MNCGSESFVSARDLGVPRSRQTEGNLATIAVVSLVLAIALLLLAQPVFAQAATQTTTQGSDIGRAIGLLAAGLAITGSCVGAGYAVGKAASSAAAAIVERPAAFGPMLILAGLGEGIAIYGLLVAFQILSSLPS